MIEIIQRLAHTFFDNMGIAIDSLEVSEQESETYLMNVKTPDSALLIGIHGQNIRSLNHLLGRMIDRATGKLLNIHLDINDYMKEKDEKFLRYLDGRIELVMKTGKDVVINGLNSYERKKAHNYISEKTITGLRTYSQGEGSERTLHIASDGIISEKKIQAEEKKKDPIIEIEEDGIGI